MQKSADAFRTISEVADDLSLPQHVLRFWETRFPQIRPLKRAGGRRYYRPADVSLLRAIRQLLYDDGYTIKGVQRLLKEQGAKGLEAKGSDARGPELEQADLDMLLDATVGPLAELTDGDPGAVGPDHRRERRSPADAALTTERLGEHRALIEAALATVEDCRRILDAVLRADRDAPRDLQG